MITTLIVAGVLYGVGNYRGRTAKKRQLKSGF